MLNGLQRAKAQSMALEVGALNRFLSFLVERGIFTSNPLLGLREGYRLCGYHGILEIMQRTGSVEPVIASADYPFSSPLGPDCLSYLEFLEALGKKCDNHRYYIVSFESFLRRRRSHTTTVHFHHAFSLSRKCERSSMRQPVCRTSGTCRFGDRPSGCFF